MQVMIRDETAGGRVTGELTLDGLDETLTVRELIRSRVYQEVDDYNRRARAATDAFLATPFQGLVTPSPDERRLNGEPVRRVRVREVDWRKQFDAACDAFERNGFFILVGDRQPESLDEPIALRHDLAVSFVKLTPLVGG